MTPFLGLGLDRLFTSSLYEVNETEQKLASVEKSLLVPVYCLLLTACCLLLTAYCLLLTAYCLLLTADDCYLLASLDEAYNGFDVF